MLRLEGGGPILNIEVGRFRVSKSEVTRLIVNVPPRSGKSLLATIFFPCWVWLRNPAERFMFASYSSTLSTKHSIDRRAVLRSRWYQRNWGDIVKFADDLNQKNGFANTQRGEMIATSVGASATGRGGNFLLADDLINPQQANSDLEREHGIRWFDETYSTRLDDKRQGRMIVIEQRTHLADLTGHLLEQGGWTHVSLQAIAERKTTIIFPRSHKTLVREENDELWPAREGHAELGAAKVRLGQFAYDAQYMQAPVSREGNLIKLDWMNATYRVIPARFDSIVLSLDTAYKTAASNDYSAAVVIGVLRKPRDGSPPGYYLLDAWRGKVEFAALKRKVVELQKTWRSHAVLVEDAASGQSLIQELRSGTRLPIKAIKPDRDKYERVTAITPVLEARRLLLPEAAWWREDFIAELTSFPAGAHDDWCDALAMALNHLRDDDHVSKWILAGNLRLGAQYYAEGLSVEKAAARAGLSVEQLQDYIDRYPPTLIYE
jgi:predicted phage terminase large subunit-like protein